MNTDLLSLIQPALDEMTSEGFAVGWTIAKAQRDSVEFERHDKMAAIFWDASAPLRWMVADADDRQGRGATLADAIKDAASRLVVL